jgi:hypothetical protein
MNELEEIFPPLEVPMVADTGIDGINGHDARLIWDLVSNLRPPKDVIESYGLTLQDFEAKKGNQLFVSAYREAERVWKSDMNIQQRIRLKAAFLLEDSLLSLFNIIRQEGIGVNAKLAAIEQLTKISTVANVPKENAATEKHNITINIGGGVAPVTATVEIPHVGTGTISG